MRKNSGISGYLKLANQIIFSMVLACCIVCNGVGAKENYKEGRQSSTGMIKDTSIEKQVDYIEQIYFSGKNKEGLTAMILATIQTMEKQQATTAVAKQ